MERKGEGRVNMEVLQVDLRRAGYEQAQEVVRDVSFSLKSGEMMGLIGPNGAGKSTTIKAILGLLKNVDGRVNLTGPRQHYSYVPEHPVLYDDLTVWEHLELAASAYNMPRADFEKKADTLLERFQLTKEKHHLPRSFSKGMQQKVMLIVGFLLQPDLYIVDEPFIGLDPRATKELLHLLMEERKRGAAVLLSTHVLDTAEKICDSFLLLSGGRCVARGTLEELRLQMGCEEASLMDCFNFFTSD
jgi:ABC-2 type transport system ATP-binding protein